MQPNILAAKNDQVDKLNDQTQMTFPGDPVEYESFDRVMDEDQAINYPTDFLNSLKPAEMLPQLLPLKVSSPVIFIRNLDASNLRNGTRLTTKY